MSKPAASFTRLPANQQGVPSERKIYTIPVHDAYNQADACPLCTLEKTLTAELIAYYLGPALMEPDVRIVTNDRGFCREHWRGLYDSEANRLGLSLLLHTHVVISPTTCTNLW